MHKGPLQFTDKVLVAVLVTAVAVLVAARLAASGDVSLTVWGDRDLWRALSVPDHWPLSGPESNGGTRSPGGAYYLLLAAILAAGRNVATVNIGVVLLFAASVLLIGVFFARRVSALAGALVAAALAGSVILGRTLGVWNPGFILFFATAATVFGYAFLADGRALPLGLAAAAVAIGMQIHLQIIQVALGLILATVIYRPRLTWRHAVAVLLGSGFSLSAQYRVGRCSAASDGGVAAGRRDQQLRVLGGRSAVAEGGAVRRSVRRRRRRIRRPRPVGLGAAAGRRPVGAAVGGGAAIATVRPPRKTFDGAPVGLFPLILLVTAVTALVSDLLPRHMVAVTPAAAALVGLAAERLVVGLSRRGLVAQAGAAAPLRLVRAAAAAGRHRRIRPGSVSSGIGGGSERDRRHPQAGLLRRPRRLRSTCRRVPPGRVAPCGKWPPTASSTTCRSSTRPSRRRMRAPTARIAWRSSPRQTLTAISAKGSPRRRHWPASARFSASRRPRVHISSTFPTLLVTATA